MIDQRGRCPVESVSIVDTKNYLPASGTVRKPMGRIAEYLEPVYFIYVRHEMRDSAEWNRGGRCSCPHPELLAGSAGGGQSLPGEACLTHPSLTHQNDRWDYRPGQELVYGCKLAPLPTIGLSSHRHPCRQTPPNGPSWMSVLDGHGGLLMSCPAAEMRADFTVRKEALLGRYRSSAPRSSWKLKGRSLAGPAGRPSSSQVQRAE